MRRAIPGKFTIAACLSAMLVSSAKSQTSRDRARELLRQADAAIGRETVASAQEAIGLSRSALTLIGVRGSTSPAATAPALDRGIAGRAFLFTGMGYRIIGVPDSVLMYVRRAIPLARGADDPSGLGLGLTELGTTLAKIGQLDSGIVLVREAVLIADTKMGPAEQVPTLIKFGNLLAEAGRLDSARQILTRGALIAAQQKMARSFGHAYRYLAGILERQARPDSALLFYRASQQVFRGMQDSVGLSTVNTELSQFFYRMHLMDSALVYSALALQFQQAHAMIDPLISSYRGRGIIFTNLRMLDSALANQREALRIARQLRLRPVEAMIESEMAMQFAATQPESALVYGRPGLAGGASLGTTNRAYASIALAIAHIALGHNDSAVSHSQRAVALPRSELSAELAYQTLGVHAIASSIAHNYPTAIAYADSATALHSRAARATGSDFLRVAFGDGDARLYKLWTMSWAMLEPERGVGARYAALAASERGRAQALLDLMTDSGRTLTPGVDLAAEGRALSDQALQNADVVISYQILDDAVLLWSRAKGGELRAEFVPATPDSLVAAIRSFRATLGVDGAARGVLARGDSLERGVVGVVAAGPDWRAAGRRLRRLLLPDSMDALLSAGKQVLIVPAGAIAVVPFGALPRATGDGVLADDLSIRYAPSLATLAAAEGRPSVPSGTSLVVSNPLMPEAVSASGIRMRLGPLPGAEQEGSMVAKRLSTAPYSGGAATESLVRLRLPFARVVHIASHGYAYSKEARARDSFVALAPDSRNDGLLTVGEIMNDPRLRLKAELVTLSACQSGLGDLRETEGTVGLQRALLGRGARTVLVSLWNVSDEATRMLMDRFYAHWVDDRDKPDKAESLRRAQIDVRKQRQFADAKYWAAFQVVGAR